MSALVVGDGDLGLCLFCAACLLLPFAGAWAYLGACWFVRVFALQSRNRQNEGSKEQSWATIAKTEPTYL
eukprot:scaffold1041_cov93-Skeletonema_dohrnii-CCMP3373.AAC.8